MRAEDIKDLFTKKNMTLACAESCTGGAVACKLTQVPGASKFFLGSLVVYANEAKQRLLNVPGNLLEKQGAVSKEVVEAMASGLLKALPADYGIAITGVAGPDGGSEKTPVGTVWLAICHKKGLLKSWSILTQGNRSEIINHAVDEILSELYRQVSVS